MPEGDRSPYRDMTFIPIARATTPRDANNPNKSPQGNALAAICAEYLGRIKRD
ncbi:hypothetical protein [Bradyrhizobium australiense]|uniref:Uncharacterized protein n=1 Tax=Bradyrhizobium australiense TaxID=2721161 RepID=A0A7Y4LYS1_9BRAD|nr:hypothetical protein [Bradyrhizobium australiense]NOJ43050.1 hypothetical protein [Bradyrhizobium australiense]